LGCKLVLGQTGLVFVVARAQSWEENVSAQQSKRQGDALGMVANQQVLTQAVVMLRAIFMMKMVLQTRIDYCNLLISGRGRQVS